MAKTYLNGLNLRVFSLPLASVGFSMDMLWHSKNSGDKAPTWLRRIISELSKD